LRHDFDRALGLTVAWAIFLVCSIGPILWMLIGSAGMGAVETAASALAGDRQRILITHTLLLGIGTAACALCVGLPLGISLGRCDPSRVRLARFALIVPLVLPSYVLGLAWVALADTLLASWTYSLPAAIAVLGFSFYPVVMLATEAAVRGVSSRLEEAACLVASPPRVWLKIVLPLIAPSLAASLLVVFVLAISDFAVPSLLRVRVYTTEVFTAFSALYDFRLATLLALPLALIGALASFAALEMSRRPSVGRAERGQTGRRWNRRRQRVGAAILGVVAVTAAALPIVVIGAEARYGRASFADAASIAAVANGFFWSTSAATVVVIVGTLLGYWRTKASPLPAHLAEMVWIALFAVPATIAGIGIIGLWNRPGLLGDIYRTDAIVVVAYVARFLPLAAMLCAASLRRVGPAAEEAAIVSGASWRRSFIRIVLPLAGRGLAVVWLVMFILMFGDVALAILVAPPGESNLAVRAYTLMANAPVGDVARIALMQIALSVLPLAGVLMLTRDRHAWD
jgi:iron(III) transport system permease protein